ncbi:PREDICTED: bifunctional D-cysteine desulfhydrase/1-aminocyclopropane-1-carboxylate deaminase, mitochondrial-like [Amphimedon queenslandica]|uniref:Tryptophan synthase beta chain-like PALP domain-containing protein n=1 Tax=Amphimedon queenslandica TaxID=400682 RepID=A0A1X7VME0_AMPQE|nr:PREDICTED: bifunctional D-cysteine desulfhydrase/1-aminocyclopropane-1-carboxylate deaminase, mitochondrial-like [Amphimedon queenslandica]|eukprot:XP_003383708.1 PREDICTED: bifunctional D-cysteine desulfhydrase/1-aminocyclopropane-1-carboxylate deaminase, mitochondrial-like [Amphimedon queenslandica]
MSSCTKACQHEQSPYTPPDWAKGLAVIPKTRIKLAQLPTPIHSWSVPGLPDGFQLYIKRDDLTGSTLSGNKVRKLEFIFSEVLDQGCDTVITGGSLQSNHARATAVVAKELGMDSHCVLFNKDTDVNIEPKGNLLLSRLTDSLIGLIPQGNLNDAFNVYSRIFTDLSNKLQAKGKKPYVIELGAASPVGCWGYIEAFKEMIDQGLFDNFDDIVVCLGAGGTACGIGVANYLTGSKLKIHGISIGMAAVQLSLHMDEELSALGLKHPDGRTIKTAELMDLADEPGLGYSLTTESELKLLTEVSSSTGIVLDTTFTLKTYQHMMRMMKETPDKFKGNRILFIHTGGLYGLKGLDETLLTSKETNKVHCIDDFVTV